MYQVAQAKKWGKERSPKRILVIRMQATGDVIITFPFVQLLKNEHPTSQIDLLTRETQVSIIKTLVAVTNVISFTNSHKRWKQLLALIIILPRLLANRYDVVLDLQVNWYSRIIRQVLFPRAFTEFEKYTPLPAAERNWNAFERSGLLKNFTHPTLSFINNNSGTKILKQSGWNQLKDLIILNPAGAFKSRNWPLEKYIFFARIWAKKYPNSQFLILGINRVEAKASLLKKELGDNLINLVSKTSLPEAFEIIEKSKLVISEDSGLMHIAWALKIPTIALIGSTDKNRSSQPGKHLITLNSDDLPCGNCMKSDCIFGEVPSCLSRYSPEMILDLSEKLLERQ
jgi:heptosyltransferase-2